MKSVPPASTTLLDAGRELDERRLQFIAEQAAGLRWQILLTACIVAAIVWKLEMPKFVYDKELR